MTIWTHERLQPENWKGERVTCKQFKYNGHRFTVYKQQNGRLVGFEREIRADLEMTVKRPKIIGYDWWKALDQIPRKSSVDGELYVLHGHRCGNAGDVSHAIAECLPTLEFIPFAIPWWNGINMKDLSLDHGNELIKEHTGLKFAPFFNLRESDTFEQLCKDAKDLGVEGWVLKESNYAGWYKVKPQKTIDCIVTGFKDGNGKYLGAVGALKVSAYINDKLVEIASVSGMSDDVRWNIDEDEDLGRICEVEYQEVGNGRRLIHAHFERWRDDKPTEQCVYNWKEL